MMKSEFKNVKVWGLEWSDEKVSSSYKGSSKLNVSFEDLQDFNQEYSLPDHLFSEITNGNPDEVENVICEWAESQFGYKLKKYRFSYDFFIDNEKVVDGNKIMDDYMNTGNQEINE